MPQNSHQKFVEARDLLADAFNKLEKTVLEKVSKAKVVAGNDNDYVENLHDEINSLQKNLAEIGS